jgi:hypothetical protein
VGLRRTLGGGVLAVLIFSVAPAAALSPALRGPTVASVLRMIPLEPGTVTTFTASCPAGFVATSGGVYTPLADAPATHVAPSGSSEWQFRLSTAVGAKAGYVTVAVACAKIPNEGFASAPKLRVRTVRSDPVELAPGDRETVTLDCPADTAPVGFGYDRQGGPVGAPAAKITRAVPARGGWSFSATNTATGDSAPDATVTFYAACLGRTVTATDARRRRLQQHLRIATALSRLPLHSGGNVLVSACPAGSTGVGAGFSLSGRATSADGVAVTLGGGRFTFASQGQSSAALYLQCLSQKTRFKSR